MERIRMGVIGCGEIAQIMHLPFLTELRDLFELRAICDISPRLVETVGEIFHVPHRYIDYAELLARDDLDAVAILTSDHAPVAIAAARAGKHIFVEKPMCFGVKEGRAIQAAAAERGIRLMVGYMKRYDPGYEYAQQLFRTMAGVRLIRVHDLTGRGPLAPQEIYSLYRADDLPEATRARLQAETYAHLAEGLGLDRPDLVRAYGTMLGLSSHDITVLRGAFGDPLAVRYAEVSSGGQIVLAVLEYPDEMRCVWEIGNIPQATRSWFDEELTVFGSAQTVTVRFPNPYVRYAPTIVHVQEMDGAAQAERAVTASYDESFRREWRHFYDCVTTGAMPRTGAAEGLRDVEILRAIVCCAADGTPVALGG
ncbi:MAG: Gfo/Idh/MocA family protein [Roseiflexaceae bacterium]